MAEMTKIPELTLRPATLSDVPVLDRWDLDPHVISATTDDAGAERAFGDHDWHVEIAQQSELSEYLIAEVDGRPIGAMQIIDPHLEPTHYWGEIEPNLRAIDTWIGDAADRSKGDGERMMRLAFQRCFADPAVTAIVIDPLATNTRANRFYQRLGFVPVGRQMFGDDDCLVHRLTREAWRARFPDD
jgi:aminoglycoside 6'-N-acetyltransferase